MSETCTEKLKFFRKSKGLSQRELCNLVGISRSHYCAIENGKRPLSQGYAEVLAKFYKITTNELFEKETTFAEQEFLKLIDENADDFIVYFNNKKIWNMFTYTGLDPNIFQLLESLNFIITVFENSNSVKYGDLMINHLLRSGLNGENIEVPNNNNLADEDIVCGIRRTNSPVTYFTKKDIEQMQNEIFNFTEFIVKRHIKAHQKEEE